MHCAVRYMQSVVFDVVTELKITSDALEEILRANKYAITFEQSIEKLLEEDKLPGDETIYKAHVMTPGFVSVDVTGTVMNNGAIVEYTEECNDKLTEAYRNLQYDVCQSVELTRANSFRFTNISVYCQVESVKNNKVASDLSVSIDQLKVLGHPTDDVVWVWNIAEMLEPSLNSSASKAYQANVVDVVILLEGTIFVDETETTVITTTGESTTENPQTNDTVPSAAEKPQSIVLPPTTKKTNTDEVISRMEQLQLDVTTYLKTVQTMDPVFKNMTISYQVISFDESTSKVKTLVKIPYVEFANTSLKPFSEEVVVAVQYMLTNYQPEVPLKISYEAMVILPLNGTHTVVSIQLKVKINGELLKKEADYQNPESMKFKELQSQICTHIEAQNQADGVFESVAIECKLESVLTSTSEIVMKLHLSNTGLQAIGKIPWDETVIKSFEQMITDTVVPNSPVSFVKNAGVQAVTQAIWLIVSTVLMQFFFGNIFGYE